LTDATFKNEIVRFVKSYYAQHGVVPSIAVILKQFGLNRADFYRHFSSLAELCGLAGVPVPEERIESVREALKGRSLQKEEQAMKTSQESLILSPQATRRIYGICQLENLEPSQAVDMLLDLDHKLRRNYHLSLAKTKQVSDFLDAAISRGWKLDPLVDYLRKAWNSGILNLGEPYLSNLISLAQGIDLNYWGSVQNFIQYATKHGTQIGYFRAYLDGKIPLEKLLQVEGFR
jgi:AcrR family transcriptional regulator